MPEDFRSIATAALESEDTASNATLGDPAAAPETPAADTGGTPPESAPTPGSEWRFNSAEWDELHPDLQSYRKQLQADHTRAQQQLAEQRKAFEGVRPELVGWARQLDQLAATDPAEAARLLQLELQRLQPPEQQFDNNEFLSESERQLDQRLRQMESFAETQRIAAIQSRVNEQFSQLEAAYGQIPLEERQAVVMQMAQHGAPPEAVRHYWTGMNVERVMAKARNEGAQAIQQKVALGPGPSSLSSRAGDVEPEPKTYAEALQRALR